MSTWEQRDADAEFDRAEAMYIDDLQERHQRDICAEGGHALIRDVLACYCFAVDNYP